VWEISTLLDRVLFVMLKCFRTIREAAGAATVTVHGLLRHLQENNSKNWFVGTRSHKKGGVLVSCHTKKGLSISPFLSKNWFVTYV
jgi:hypothetical protein